MFDNRKNNPVCNFSDEIVSYLYDEFSDSEKVDFEDHLTACRTCVEEIAAYGFVRSSIQDWKKTDFNNLKLPSIKIEFDKPTRQIQTVSSDSENITWLEKLNNLLSPLAVKTAAGFAAIAIFLGLGWFLLSSSADKTPETAVKNNEENLIREIKKNENENEKADSLKSEISKETDENSLTENVIEQTETANENSSGETDRENSETVFKKTSRKTTNKGIISQQNNSDVAGNSDKLKANQNGKVNPSVSKKQTPEISEQKPSLLEFAVDTTEDEDEIRLSDIFDEVGSDRN